MHLGECNVILNHFFFLLWVHFEVNLHNTYGQNIITKKHLKLTLSNEMHFKHNMEIGIDFQFSFYLKESLEKFDLPHGYLLIKTESDYSESSSYCELCSICGISREALINVSYFDHVNKQQKIEYQYLRKLKKQNKSQFEILHSTPIILNCQELIFQGLKNITILISN